MIPKLCKAIKQMRKVLNSLLRSCMLFAVGLNCLKLVYNFQSIDEEVLELEHLKHPPPPSGGANTKEEILPQLEKQLEEEAQASASITSSDEDTGDDDDDNDDDNDTGGDTNTDDSDDDDEGNSDYAEKLAKASESMLLKTLAEFHHQQQRQNHHQDGSDTNKFDSVDENMNLMKVGDPSARRHASLFKRVNLLSRNIENNVPSLAAVLTGIYVFRNKIGCSCKKRWVSRIKN